MKRIVAPVTSIADLLASVSNAQITAGGRVQIYMGKPQDSGKNVFVAKGAEKIRVTLHADERNGTKRDAATEATYFDT